MSKEVEERVGIIKKADYIPELELKVKLETAKAQLTAFPRVNKKYTHIEVPNFNGDKKAQLDWEMEEIRRCREGFDNLPGKYYYVFNHCRIKHKTRGKIRPDFRSADLAWFKFLEQCQKDSGIGIVCLKRRQVGMSWKAAMDVLHDCTFNREFQVGMNSKGDADSRNLFQKVKYVHRNLPDFLRPVASAVDRRDAMDFSKIEKDEFGNRKRRGTESTIISVPPTPTGHAGNQYTKLIMDEAGETEALEQIWSNAEDCLMVESVRAGLAIMFGTMGETDKAGRGLMEFYKNNELYNFKRFEFWGYNSLIMDDYGNCDLEESIRWIIYQRHKKEGGSKAVYQKFIQKYPLNAEDAFLTVGGSGIGNPVLIGKRKLELMDNPPQKAIGRMRRNPDQSVDFVPDPNGKIIVYERPDPNRKNGYLAGADPSDHNDVTKTRDSSNLALTIVAKPYGVEPAKLVLEYVDRPMNLDTWFEQAAMSLQWYNNTKALVEDNRARMVNYFKDKYPNLLAMTPRGINSVKNGVELKYGIKMTAERKEQLIGLIESYLDNNIDWIPSMRILDECGNFGAPHLDDDAIISFGWTLFLLQSDKTIVTNISTTTNIVQPLFKKSGGVIQLTTLSKQTPKFQSNSRLFKR